MTDFVISEEQLNTYPYENPVWRKKTEAAIRSRPLSDELTDAYRNGYIDGQSKAAVENERNNNGRLKAERKRVLDEIPVIIRSDKDCIIRHNGFDYIRLIDVDVAVESLRGEP